MWRENIRISMTKNFLLDKFSTQNDVKEALASDDKSIN